MVDFPRAKREETAKTKLRTCDEARREEVLEFPREEEQTKVDEQREAG